MKRIAINCSHICRRSLLSKAFSAMTGLHFIESIPYSIIAYQYKLIIDKSKCQWPDTFTYCLEAFTRKIMIEQKFDDRYISNGGVFSEISWLKYKYSQELNNEMSMIENLEKVIMNYASNEYDYIFHIDSKEADVFDQCLRKLYDFYDLKHYLIDDSDDESALHQMLGHLQVKPVLSAKYALLKFSDENHIYVNTHENSD